MAVVGGMVLMGSLVFADEEPAPTPASSQSQDRESASEDEFKAVEYDFVRAALLDLRVSFKALDELQFRVGQWKVPFNRERIDSSGKQQFAERSIVTPCFTLDISRINDRSGEPGRRWENRARLQWDVSF